MRRVLVMAGCLVILGLAPSAAAVSTVWVGGDGSWYDAPNWTAGVPGAGDDALVNNAATATAASGPGQNVARASNLTIGFADGVQSGSGTVETQDVDLVVGGLLAVGLRTGSGGPATGVLDTDNSIFLAGTAHVFLGNDLSVGTVLSGAGPLEAIGQVAIDGQLNATGTGTGQIKIGTSEAEGDALGDVDVAAGGTVEFDQAWIGLTSASGDAAGGFLFEGGTLSGDGTSGLRVGTSFALGEARGTAFLGAVEGVNSVSVGTSIAADPDESDASNGFGNLDLDTGDLAFLPGVGLLRVGYGEFGAIADGQVSVAGDVLGANLVTIGYVEEGTGSADGELAVAGTLEAGGLRVGVVIPDDGGDATGRVEVGDGGSLIGTTRVGFSAGSGNAAGNLLFGGGALMADGSADLQVGVSRGAGLAQGTAVLGSATGVDEVLVGISIPADEDANRATGSLTVDTGDLAFGDGAIDDLYVGYSEAGGEGVGHATVAGDVLDANRVLVGTSLEGGPVEGTLMVGGSFHTDADNAAELRVGVTDSALNATGDVDVTTGGSACFGSAQIGVRGGNGDAMGSVDFGGGSLHVAGSVGIGVAGGDESGNAMGSLLTGELLGEGGILRVGLGLGTGALAVEGDLGGFAHALVGVEGGEGSILLRGGDMEVGALTIGTPTVVRAGSGLLSVEAGRVDVAALLSLGVDGALELFVDGPVRGVDYGAIDAGDAVLGGALDVVFRFAAREGDVFDLIALSPGNDFGGTAFASIDILGLGPGLSTVTQIVDDPGGFEVFRLFVVPEPGTLGLLLLGPVLVLPRVLRPVPQGRRRAHRPTSSATTKHRETIVRK